MNKRILTMLVLLVAGALALSACGATLPPAKAGVTRPQTGPSGPKISSAAQQFARLQGDAGRGKTKFTGTCASCHGENAKGMPGLGKDLTVSAFVKSQSNADLILFLTKGRPASDKLNTTGVDMPPKGGNPALNNQDLADIVWYVRTLEVK
jgi:disulfide bond formation protein DsbB